MNLERDKPFTHEELCKLGIDYCDGMMLAFDVHDVQKAAAEGRGVGSLVIGMEPSAKARFLLSAAPSMYQHLHNQYRVLDQIIALLEPLKGLDAITKVMVDMQNQLLTAMRIATHGAETVAKEAKAGLTKS